MNKEIQPSLKIVKVPLSDEEMVERLTLPVKQRSEVLPSQPLAVAAVGAPLTLDTLRQRINNGVSFAVTDRVDGIGAQALAKISAMVMAQALGCDYAHIPFDHLEHCEQNMKLSDYCERWENVLQLKSSQVTERPHFPNTHNLCKSESALIEIQCQNFKVGHLYCFRDCHTFTEYFRDELRDAWKTVIHTLRERRKQVITASLSESFTVAVHVRRGDVTSRDTKRWASDDYYIDVIRSVKKDFPLAQFHIVSEGDPADFAGYQSLSDDVHLHISPPNVNNRLTKSLIAQPKRPQFVAGGARNQHLLNRRGIKTNVTPVNAATPATTTPTPTVFDAFEILTSADVLIMSKSTFSYLAAIYNTGRKICPPDMWLSVPKWCEESDFWFTDPKRLF